MWSQWDFRPKKIWLNLRISLQEMMFRKLQPTKCLLSANKLRRMNFTERRFPFHLNLSVLVYVTRILQQIVKTNSSFVQRFCSVCCQNNKQSKCYPQHQITKHNTVTSAHNDVLGMNILLYGISVKTTTLNDKLNETFSIRITISFPLEYYRWFVSSIAFNMILVSLLTLDQITFICFVSSLLLNKKIPFFRTQLLYKILLLSHFSVTLLWVPRFKPLFFLEKKVAVFLASFLHLLQKCDFLSFTPLFSRFFVSTLKYCK